MSRRKLQPTQRNPRILRERARGALKLVRAGLLDGDLALSYVVWPSQAIRDQEKAA